MGRPSRAAERRIEILEAAAACIREVGLEATTLERIARRAGVQRTIIRHYIGNRDAVLAALAEYLTAQYRSDYAALAAALPDEGRVEAMLSYLFKGAFRDRPDEDALVDTLFAAAPKNEGVRRAMLRMYRAFEDTCTEELAAAYPGAPRAKIRAVAYAVMCLAECNGGMIALGFPPRRAAAAHAAATRLVSSLGDAEQ